MRHVRFAAPLAASVAAVALATATAVAPTAAVAQEQAASPDQQARPGVQALGEWDYQGLYSGGFRAETLLDAEVFGAEGGDRREEIGSVENVLIGPDDRIVAIVAQVGGLWDIGDTHVVVPWDQVTLTADGVHVPVNEENVEDYGLFEETSYVTQSMARQRQVVDDDLDTGPNIWKLTDLVDDYATLSDATGYGYVDDAVFSQDGKLTAVLVEPDAGYGAGPLATPFYGYDYGWNPGLDTYDVGYGANELAGLDPFDNDAVEGPLD